MTNPGRFILPLLLVGFIACAPARVGTERGVEPPPPRPAAPDAAEGKTTAAPDVRISPSDDDVLVVVDGQAVRKTHLADFFVRFQRDRTREALTQIVDTLLVTAEGDREGVAVPPGKLEEAVEQTIESRRQELRKRSGGEVAWATYLKRTLGLEPEAYEAEVRHLLEVSMRLDRLIRLGQTRTERLDVRVIVVLEEDEARDVTRKLRGGADVVTLAREVSLAPLVAPPPIPVDELPEGLRQHLTALEPGQVSDPYRLEQDGREVWQVYRLVRRIEARDAPWSELAAEIEKGLERRPREPWEYEEWSRRARARHRIEWSIR
jgi:hypothetical protein